MLLEWAKDGANALVDGIGDAGEFVKDKISEAANNISDLLMIYSGKEVILC